MRSSQASLRAVQDARARAKPIQQRRQACAETYRSDLEAELLGVGSGTLVAGSLVPDALEVLGLFMVGRVSAAGEKKAVSQHS